MRIQAEEEERDIDELLPQQALMKSMQEESDQEDEETKKQANSLKNLTGIDLKLLDIDKSKKLIDYYLSDMESKMDKVQSQQEQKYLTQVTEFIQKKENELNKILQSLSSKTTEIGEKEK